MENSECQENCSGSHREQENPKEEEEEPLDISQLSEEVISAIISKVRFVDFMKLEEASKLMARVCNTGKYSLPYDFYTAYVHPKKLTVSKEFFLFTIYPFIPFHVAATSAARIEVRSLFIRGRITGGRMRAVTKLFKKSRVRADCLFFSQRVLFAPDDLDDFIETLRPKFMESQQYMSKEFLQLPGMQNISSMLLNACGCTDEELLGLKGHSLFLRSDAITAKGFNRYFKQWKFGDRDMQNCTFEFDTSFNTRRFDQILEGLDANLIWSPDSHRDSLIGCINPEELGLMNSADPQHFYSLFRSSNIADKRLLVLELGQISVITIFSESVHLLQRISDDHYYQVTNLCYDCNLTICKHRRRFSTQRFKKLFPKTNAGIILCFQMGRAVFSCLRHIQLLYGAPNIPVQPLPTRNLARILYEDHTRYHFLNYLTQLRILLFNH